MIQKGSVVDTFRLVTNVVQNDFWMSFFERLLDEHQGSPRKLLHTDHPPIPFQYLSLFRRACEAWDPLEPPEDLA